MHGNLQELLDAPAPCKQQNEVARMDEELALKILN